MTKDRFKEIYDRSNHTPIVLLFEVFREESNSKIDLQDFQGAFQMWLMMKQPFSHQNESINKIITYLKDKYK